MGEQVEYSEISKRGFKTATRSAIVLAICSMGLSGCAIGQLSNITGGFLGGSKTESVSTWEPQVTEERLLAAAKEGPQTGPDITAAINADTCPKFAVWPNDRQVTIYEIGQVGDPKAVRHRGEITKTARECSFADNRLTMKFGIAGRVLLGIRGQAGPVTLPANVFVTDANRVKVKTEKISITANVPADKPYGYFSLVNRLSIDLPPGAQSAGYKVFVAFDRAEPGAG